MKKNIFYLLGLVSTLLLSGCAKTNSKNVIKFQFLKAGLGTEVYEKLAEAYQNEHPGVKVKLIPNYTINDDVDKQITRSNCSDIYTIRDITKMKRLYAQKLILDLTDTVFNAEIEDGKTLNDLMDPMAIDYTEFNGAHICVPEYMNVNGFVYDKALFDQYGWTVPTTTEEMKALCDQILSDTGGRVKPFVTCSNADGYFYYLLDGINNSYEGITNMKEIYKFDTPEIFNPANRTGKLRALETMREWYLEANNYVVRGSLAFTHTVAQQMILDHEAAMMLNGSWFENEMAKFIKPENNMAMFPIPEYSEGGVVKHAPGFTDADKNISCEYTADYIIPAKAKNKEGAIDFLKFICRSDMCELYNKTCNSVRPMQYNKDSSSETYKDMSTFGKSVLDMAANNNTFVPYSKAQITIDAGWSFWPLADGDPYHIKAMLQNGTEPTNRLQKEYELAKQILG